MVSVLNGILAVVRYMTDRYCKVGLQGLLSLGDGWTGYDGTSPVQVQADHYNSSAAMQAPDF